MKVIKPFSKPLSKQVTLKLANTLTNSIEEFIPLKQGHVSIYCCGVTVYDLCHLGHARSYIVWDILRRYFLWQGYKVNFVQNFTDIDDKILARAALEKSSMNEISERNIKEFHLDMDALGVLRPDRMPRATKCLEGIKSMIRTLEKKGAAYSIEGDVYFSVMKHSEYGKLSRRELSQQKLNADGRIKSDEEIRKQNPFDFALWKRAKKGETSFPSPWGEGRPGWHIECSAMVLQELGETIDIHLGGADLIFPHHENEIAQSEIATGKKLANYWLHNGMVNIGGQKMSKSLGNFKTIRSLLKEGISAMTLRLFILQAHYRKPIDFTKDSIDAAKTGWERLNGVLCIGFTKPHILNWPKIDSKEITLSVCAKESKNKTFFKFEKEFLEALSDDLNTSVALSVLFDLARPIRSIVNQIERNLEINLDETNTKELHSRWLLLINLAEVLGLKAEIKKEGNEKDMCKLSELQIITAIKKRKAAKSVKDFKKADQIRQELKEQGIELIDKPGEVTHWIRN